MQMSQMGGSTITMKGINAWHTYMTDHYQFGKETGVEQGYESAGLIPPADANASAFSTDLRQHQLWAGHAGYGAAGRSSVSGNSKRRRIPPAKLGVGICDPGR